MTKLSLILASQSPRRKELLGQLGIPFEVWPPSVEEKCEKSDPAEIARELARLKGEDVFAQAQKRGDNAFVVISSDTLVTYEGEIFGKPRDLNQAREFLQKLSGKTHQVISGVCLHLQRGPGETYQKEFAVQTDVTFSSMPSELCERYLAAEDSLDKAGAYGIQGPSSLFVKEVRGSYSNVVGLPLVEFIEELETLLLNTNLWPKSETPLKELFGQK